MSIYKKINKFKEAVKGIKKSKSNTFHKNKYATIEDVLEAVEQPLKDNELGFVQCVNEMYLETTVYSTDDKDTDYIFSKIPLILSKQDMQQLGGAITYARRYALVSMLGLEQEDDDGNYASGYTPKQQNNKFNNTPKEQEKPASVKQYSVNDIIELAKVKSFDLELIENAYGKKLDMFNLGELNKAYKTLQGK